MLVTKGATYFLSRDGGPHVSSLASRTLSQVGVDQSKVEVRSSPARLGVDLLDEALQLLESGVHPGVHLELVTGSVTCRIIGH